MGIEFQENSVFLQQFKDVPWLPACVVEPEMESFLPFLCMCCLLLSDCVKACSMTDSQQFDYVVLDQFVPVLLGVQ